MMLNLGKRLKEIRKQRNLTQEQLAKTTGISRSYLSDVENNRKNPSIKTVELLASKLDMTFCEFICNCEEVIR